MKLFLCGVFVVEFVVEERRKEGRREYFRSTWRLVTCSGSGQSRLGSPSLA